MDLSEDLLKKSPSPSPSPTKVDLSPDLSPRSPSPDLSTTSLKFGNICWIFDFHKVV